MDDGKCKSCSEVSQDLPAVGRQRHARPARGQQSSGDPPRRRNKAPETVHPDVEVIREKMIKKEFAEASIGTDVCRLRGDRSCENVDLIGKRVRNPLFY